MNENVTLYRCPKCKVGEYDDDGTSGDYKPQCFNCGTTLSAYEPVTYAPVNEEREAAVREMRHLLAVIECTVCDNRGFTTMASHHSSCDGDCSGKCPVETQLKCQWCDERSVAIARFDRAEGRVG